MRPSLNSDDIRRLFDYEGPIGSFSARIRVAYAFNLFGPETRDDLDLIRLIRNEFAHSGRPFGFSEPLVKPVTDRLASPDWPGAAIPGGYLTAISSTGAKSSPDKGNPKTRYVCACHVISTRMLGYTGGIASGLKGDLR
jgi:hypothetical protein